MSSDPAQRVARLEAELEAARDDARRSARALLELETRRAAELDALHAAEAEAEFQRAAAQDAHRVIQTIHRMRVWRLASSYWRARDSLLRRD